MNKPTKQEQDIIEGYAIACQDLMYSLTGENTNGKHYDPIQFEEEYILSYAFDFKNGGRRHYYHEFRNVNEVIKLMREQAVKWIKEG